jgi:hypothetical protein
MISIDQTKFQRLLILRGYDVSIGYYLDNNFGTAQPDVACLYTLGKGYKYEYAFLMTQTGPKSGTV